MGSTWATTTQIFMPITIPFFEQEKAGKEQRAQAQAMADQQAARQAELEKQAKERADQEDKLLEATQNSQNQRMTLQRDTARARMGQRRTLMGGGSIGGGTGSTPSYQGGKTLIGA